MKNSGVTLGLAVRSIRQERGWSLREAGERTGLSISMLSKVENGQRSLTYDKLIKLADSLSVDISRLFTNQGAEASMNLHAGRRSVQKASDGFVIEAGVYTYTYLAQDLVNKRFLPVLMDLHARSVEQFESLLRHEGEEFAFVIEGEVDVYSEVYAPLRLKVGESVFFESSVGHAYVNAGSGRARLMVIASDATAKREPRELPIAQRARGSDEADSASAASSHTKSAPTLSASPSLARKRQGSAMPRRARRASASRAR